jgi:uncharacterized protein (TIRG00374 family)
MKKHLITIFSTIIGLVALWLLFDKFPLSWEEFSSFNTVMLISWLTVTLFIFFVHAFRWKIILDANGMKLPFWRAFIYRLIGNSVSYFTPAAKLGGEPVRAMLVKRHHNSLKNALSTVVIDKAMELASSGIFFVLGIIILLTSFALPRDLQIILLITGILIVWIIYYYYSNMFQGKRVMVKIFRKFNLHNVNKLKKYERKLIDFEDVIIGFYTKNKKAFITSMVISAITWLLMFVEYKLATLMLGLNISYFGLFLIFSFVGAAYVIPIPMSLGSLEASQVGIFKILGLGAAGGLALSVLIRLRDLLWGVVGLIMLSFFGFNIRKTLEEDTRIDEEIERMK